MPALGVRETHSGQPIDQISKPNQAMYYSAGSLPCQQSIQRVVGGEQ